MLSPKATQIDSGSELTAREREFVFSMNAISQRLSSSEVSHDSAITRASARGLTVNLREVSAYTGRAVREDRFKPGSAPEQAFKEAGEPKPCLAAKRGFHGLWFKVNGFVLILDCPMRRGVPVQELFVC